jgi:hypothetical protein
MLVPGRQRINQGGLDTGASLPVLLGSTVAGDPLVIDPQAGRRAAAVLFTHTACPLCAALAEDQQVADIVARYPGIDFYWIGQEEPPPSIDATWTVVLDSDGSLPGIAAIPAYPFMYAVGQTGEIASKGLVNTIDDLEMLIARDDSRQSSLETDHV